MTITGLKARHSVTISRAGQVAQPGIRLRAPSTAIGSDSRTPKKVARTAISMLSTKPVSSWSQFL